MQFWQYFPEYLLGSESVPFWQKHFPQTQFPFPEQTSDSCSGLHSSSSKRQSHFDPDHP